jgi:Domain of unknown function (DUF5666)
MTHRCNRCPDLQFVRTAKRRISVRFKAITSKGVIALTAAALVSILMGAADAALAADSVITRASYTGGVAANAAAALSIHGSFAAGNTPVVTLGDISTATSSGNPPSSDLVVTSFSTTDIVVTVSHPLDSGLIPATYRLVVRNFDAAEREWRTVTSYLAISTADLGLDQVSGPITAIAPPSFTVGNKIVTIDAHTKFSGAGNPKSLADLQVGDKVQVTGQLRPDGSLLASAVVRLAP